jgi:1-acyl-sn-glycerol-3-phosphate acyltransferase
MVRVLLPGDNLLTRVARAVFALTLAPACRLRTAGSVYLPPTGAALVAVNHKSDIDPIFVGLAFRRQLRYFAKAELFEHRAFGWAITELGAIRVRRGESDRGALEAALTCLAQGEALMVFPEGTRFPDDEIHAFQRGIGMLAMRSHAPVIPVALRGSRDVSRRGRPRATRVRLEAGPPVDLSGLEGRRSAVYAEAAERIERDVRALYERL